MSPHPRPVAQSPAGRLVRPRRLLLPGPPGLTSFDHPCGIRQHQGVLTTEPELIDREYNALRPNGRDAHAAERLALPHAVLHKCLDVAEDRDAATARWIVQDSDELEVGEQRT